MRYLLVVGFTCKVFRKEPQARIFVGDQLVDEFYISHTPSNFCTAREEFLQKCHPLQPFASTEIHNLRIKNLPPLKFYELQIDDKISNLAIRIDIGNSDSNHSNGYMTRSTLIMLEVCYFFPLEQRLLRPLEKIQVKRRMSENYAWYRVLKNNIFNLAVNGMCWQGVNGQKITNAPGGGISTYSTGGDGVFVCELTKKYGILMPKLARACRHTFNNITINYLFDKYFHHAHQRDSD